MGMAATLTVLAVLLAVLLAAGFWVGLALLVTGLAGLVLVGANNAGNAHHQDRRDRYSC